MVLRDLIDTLAKADPERIAPVGFTFAHSYRGYYEDLAFEPCATVSVAFMLTVARGALGKTYQGYKGGDYTMSELTTVWLSYYGQSGESMGPVLLSYMLGTPTVPAE